MFDYPNLQVQNSEPLDVYTSGKELTENFSDSEL